jgi:hypothetical protein
MTRADDDDAGAAGIDERRKTPAGGIEEGDS